MPCKLALVARRPLAALLPTLLAGVASCWAPVCRAQVEQGEPSEARDLADLSLEELMQVEIVSANRRAQRLAEVPEAVHVITREDIIRSGVRSLAEALRLAPGVDVAQLSAARAAIGVRGDTGRFSDKLQVLIDGRSVYSPLHSGVFWEVERVPLEDVERIEVIRGPAGAVWGTNAVNGVINILTREADRLEGSAVTTELGSDGTDRLLLRHGTQTRSGSWLHLYAQADRQEQSRDTAGRPAGDEAHVHTAGFRWDAAAGTPDRWSVQGQFLRAFTHDTWQIPILTAPYSERSAVLQQFDRGLVQGLWERRTSAASQWRLQGSVQVQEAQQSKFARQSYRALDVDAQHDWRPAGAAHRLTWGAGFNWYHDDVKDSAWLTFDPTRRTIFAVRTFAQDEITLVPDRWILHLGARVDHHPYVGAQTSPSVRLLWKLSPSASAWLAASRAVRAPSRGEADTLLDTVVFAPRIETGGLPLRIRLQANPDARIVEKVRALEAGWRGQLRPNLSIDMAAYLHRYDPLLGFDLHSIESIALAPDESHIVATAVGRRLKATTTGIEVALDWRPYAWWRQQFQVSTVAFTQDGAAGFSTALARSPKVIVSLRESFDLGPRWTLDVRLRHTSQRHDDNLAVFNVPARTAVDANLRWAIRTNLTLALGAHNLGPRYRQEIGPDYGYSVATQTERAWSLKLDAGF